MKIDDERWQRIQNFVQEAGIVLDYLHWRVLCKRYGEQPASPLFLMTADSDGELTEEMVIAQLEAIARQARAGFVDGPDFPVFAPLDRGGKENKMEEIESSSASGRRGVEFLGMRRLEIALLKNGNDGNAHYRFSLDVSGVPEEFFVMPEIECRESDDGKCGGESVADSGIVCFDLTLGGEKRSLWFNAWTSDTVVLDADGKICRNLREAIAMNTQP